MSGRIKSSKLLVDCFGAKSGEQLEKYHGGWMTQTGALCGSDTTIRTLARHGIVSIEEEDRCSDCAKSDPKWSYCSEKLPCNNHDKWQPRHDPVDLTKCPSCGGPADNGFDRCDPPNAYVCSKCETNPAAHEPDCCCSVCYDNNANGHKYTGKPTELKSTRMDTKPAATVEKICVNPDTIKLADHILNHYSKTSDADKICLARRLEKWAKEQGLTLRSCNTCGPHTSINCYSCKEDIGRKNRGLSGWQDPAKPAATMEEWQHFTSDTNYQLLCQIKLRIEKLERQVVEMKGDSRG